MTDLEVDVLIYTVDAQTFKDAFISGANKLCNNKNLLNDLNVFPVPDGDTGSNMSMTVLAAVRELSATAPQTVGDVMKCVSSASLRGARGNSGVILSQIFRGMAKGLKDMKTAEALDLANAFCEGVTAAYRAVMKPAEGTILSVTRDGSEKALEEAKRSNDIIKFLTVAVEESQISLDRTPELLPQLKEAGVVDAGGQGILFMLQGALSYLQIGEITELMDTPDVSKAVGTSAFAADIKFSYCTEFLINKTHSNAETTSFANTIQNHGDSMVVIDDEGIVKVHIHTNRPGFIVERALKLGELTSIKIDNMKYQHDAIVMQKDEKAEKEPPKEYGFAAVACGKGLSDILRDMQIDAVIEGGQTMNPSTEDIYSAIKDINANNIIILPNNKNIIMAAEQVKGLIDKNIVVIPTRSVPEGISAKLAFSPDVSLEENIAAMTDIISNVKTGIITYAVRSFSFEGKSLPEGKILGLENGKITKVGDKPEEVLKALADSMITNESEILSVYYGNDVSEGDAEEVAQFLEETYSECDVVVYSGGQPLYYYILSVE